MNECINRNSIYNKLQALFNYWLNSIESQTISISYAKQRILPMIMEELPAADVAPVVHGRWEYTPQTFNTLGQIRCPFCAWWSLDQSIDGIYKYCPNYGAKMDGGAK